jgi:hypothetical protein
MLSNEAKKRMVIAVAHAKYGKELTDAIDANTAKVAADVAAISTANATDLPSAEALANQLKTTVNAMLTNFKAAGLMS